jgi:cytochrome c551/c552
MRSLGATGPLVPVEDYMTMRWIGLFLCALISAAPGPSAAPGFSAQKRTPLPPAELAKQNGCFECHSVKDKLIGPSFLDIAERYKGDTKARERLIAVLKKGGRGNWPELNTRGVPMPPYSGRLNDQEISSLVDWTLESGKR